MLDSKMKHGLLVCTVLTLTIIYSNPWKADPVDFDPWERYGVPWTTILYLISLAQFLCWPQIFCSILGMLYCNPFSKRAPLKGSPKSAPFICMRVVTKGTYPKLVRSTVRRNLETCLDVGLKNFCFDVVTEEAIDVDRHPKVKEIIVPASYRTKKGTLFKARALQYCLEDSVNVLEDSAWVVHLDEETIVTKDSMVGILNFVMDGKHSLGQGVITYADLEVVNWVTTLVDAQRVTDDWTRLRFELSTFHRTYFGWKGSFMVVNFGAERAISFDGGPKGSISEDTHFALRAGNKGYTFNFIEGEMWEKSPFTFNDMLRQRTRHLQGAMLVAQSESIPILNRIPFASSVTCQLLSPLTILFASMYPLPHGFVFRTMQAFLFMAGVNIFVLGNVKTFHRFGLFGMVMCSIGSLCLTPFSIFYVFIVNVMAVFSKKHFYVVGKEKES